MIKNNSQLVTVFLLSLFLAILFQNSLSSSGYTRQNNPSYTSPNNYIDIEITADKDVYVYGEKIILTIKNIDEYTATGVCRLNIFLINDTGYSVVYKAVPSELNVTSLEPNTNFTYTWNQKDYENNQVPKGDYLIEVYFVHCHGVQASDITTIRIQGPVYIERINDGNGITVTVRNIGETAISDIQWRIEINAPIVLQGSNSEGTIAILNKSEEFELFVQSFGLGNSIITIAIEDETRIVNCFLIGKFTFII